MFGNLPNFYVTKVTENVTVFMAFLSESIQDREKSFFDSKKICLTVWL